MASPESCEQDLVEVAVRFLLAVERKSFRPGWPTFDPSWVLEEALRVPVAASEVTRLLRSCCWQPDVLRGSEATERRFANALAKQLLIFETWNMFNLQELLHWDQGMRRLKEGVTCWTVSTLRCQLLPRKFFLQPLLLAKRWGLHFERKSRLPGPIWSSIATFLEPPCINWWESPGDRRSNRWWDWARHPLVFPLLSGNHGGVVGVCVFQGPGCIEDCMHSQQRASLELNDVRFLTHTATKKQLWDRLAMIAGLPDSRETDIPFDFSLPEALLALCIFMRLKYSMPLFLLDTGGRSARALQLVSLLLRRRLQGFPVSQDFSGPSGSSLVVLECSWKIWSLHEHGAKILESMLAHLQRSNLDQPALGVLQAEPSMNALELLSRLPRTVREHLMLA